MTIILNQVELRKVEISTRMPFRYGIATLTAVPYLMVFAEFEVDGQRCNGIAADILPPKWFTKQPEASIEDEIAEMLMVIRTACSSAMQITVRKDVYSWWQDIYQRQMSNSALGNRPPLLKGFGISLLERAAIDATCRRHETTFHQAVQTNLLGIQLEQIHPELKGFQPADLLPQGPQQKIKVRHTVGLVDPLSDAEITDAVRLDDGLPQSLEACIRDYKISCFKIKVPANIDEARLRLLKIDTLLRRSGQEFRFTLDGNEFHTDPSKFRLFWNQIRRDEQLREFIDDGLLVVEQPLHRDVALSEETRQVFNFWEDRPPIIIDESDGEILSLRQALDTGYMGTSHKNCKGVIKGLANVCLVNHLNSQSGNKSLVCTGEDLMNVGPVALLQDLAVGAAMGLTHMERNGHHYVTGLRHMPEEVQRKIQKCHGDLYREHKSHGVKFSSLAIDVGQMSLESVNRAPFGYAIDLNRDLFELIESF